MVDSDSIRKAKVWIWLNHGSKDRKSRIIDLLVQGVEEIISVTNAEAWDKIFELARDGVPIPEEIIGTWTNHNPDPSVEDVDKLAAAVATIDFGLVSDFADAHSFYVEENFEVLNWLIAHGLTH